MTRRLSRGDVVGRAADLADTIGLVDVTLTKVARALDITAPGVYRHVANIGELRAAIAQLAAVELTARLSVASAGLSGKDALVALAVTFRGWAADHPGRHTALQTAPDHSDAAHILAAGNLLDVFALSIRAYRLEGDDLTDAIRLTRSALQGFVMLEASNGFKQARSTDATFERVIDSLHTVFTDWSCTGTGTRANARA